MAPIVAVTIATWKGISIIIHIENNICTKYD